MDMTGIKEDIDIDNDANLIDSTAFSIVFSPSGKLIIHDVTIRNKDGVISGTGSNDDVFNTNDNVTKNQIGMFVQDEDGFAGLEKESSRTSFVIYDRKKFATYFEDGDAYSGYLEGLESVYINVYTGAIIDK